MSVLDPRRVATQQAGALFDVTLADILRFAEFPNSLSYHHGKRLPPSEILRAVARELSLGYEAAITLSFPFILPVPKMFQNLIN